MMQDESTVDEGVKPMIVAHLLIRDPQSGEVLLNQRDIPVYDHEMKGKVNAID
jgi:hypothetical protein